MNRADLLRAADLARAAADAATIAASFDRIRPEQAERFARRSEEALYAALDALSLAALGPVRSQIADFTIAPAYAARKSEEERELAEDEAAHNSQKEAA